MPMTKVLLYSDCDFFAGCENMMAILMNSDQFFKKYSPTFCYRKSIAYEMGLNKRIDRLESVRPSGIMAVRRAQLPFVVRDNYFARVCWRLCAIFAAPCISLVNLISMWRLLSNSHRDVIIINNGGYPGAASCLQAAFIAKLLGFNKVIMIVNNTAKKPKNIIKWLVHFRDRHVFQSINIVVTGSLATGNALKESRRVVSPKLVVIPNGIDDERFNVEDIVLRRGKKFAPNQALNVSIVGLHEERKGHQVLLASIFKLSTRRPDLAKCLKIIVEGEGDLTPMLMCYVKEVNISHIVRFVGHAKNMSTFYSDTDILVLPSLHSEDLPNVISEAMLFGIPTIGSNIAGIPSQIEDGFNGFLIEPGDSNRLAFRLEELLESPETVAKMSANCVETFYNKFHSDIAVSQYINLIEGDF